VVSDLYGTRAAHEEVHQADVRDVLLLLAHRRAVRHPCAITSIVLQWPLWSYVLAHDRLARPPWPRGPAGCRRARAGHHRPQHNSNSLEGVVDGDAEQRRGEERGAASSVDLRRLTRPESRDGARSSTGAPTRRSSAPEEGAFCSAAPHLAPRGRGPLLFSRSLPVLKLHAMPGLPVDIGELHDGEGGGAPRHR
jgi:hypothetical protein